MQYKMKLLLKQMNVIITHLSRAFCVGINLKTLAASNEFLAKLSVLPDLGVEDFIPLQK